MEVQPTPFMSSFWGSFFGFVFALALFYITEWIKSYRFKKQLKKYLVKEFKFNLLLFEEWKQTIERMLRGIAAQDRQTYGYLRYSEIVTYFLQRSYQEGIITDIIKDEDIKDLSNLLSMININAETYVNKHLIDWKSGSIDQKNITQKLNHELDELNKHRKLIEGLMDKFN